MGESPFNEFESKYYDLIYADKDYRAESAWIVSILHSIGLVPPRTIFSFGSGMGEHESILSSPPHDFHVLCSDGSPHMVDLLRSRHPDLFSFHIDLSQRPPIWTVSPKVDAALCLFNTFGYLTTYEQAFNAFHTFSHFLAVGGILLLDFWNARAVNNYPPSYVEKKNTLGDHVLTRQCEPTLHNLTDVTLNYIYHLDSDSPFAIRHENRAWFLSELHLIAKHSGFQFIDCKEFMKEVFFHDSSWVGLSIFQKVEG
jgi:hypothetical protein